MQNKEAKNITNINLYWAMVILTILGNLALDSNGNHPRFYD